MITAHPEWEISKITIQGDGNDCLLFENPNKENFTHGIVKLWQVPLSLLEAKSLIWSLQQAINHYEATEYSVQRYFEENPPTAQDSSWNENDKFIDKDSWGK